MKYINILSLLLLVTLIIIIANIYNFFLYKRININTIHNALHINANSLTEKNIFYDDNKFFVYKKFPIGCV